MTAIMIYLSLVIIICIIGSTKGRGVDGFVLSLLLTPIVGLIWVIVMPDSTKVKCKKCKGLVDKSATVCMHCKNALN